MNKLKSVFIFVLIITTFMSCIFKKQKSLDTLIIIDAFSTLSVINDGNTFNEELDKNLRREISNKYKKNRKSEAKIIVCFGQDDNDQIEIKIDENLKKLSFREFDIKYKNFENQRIQEIVKEIKSKSAYDQSNYIGTFGTQYLLKERKNEFNKIIFIGNLVEKEFFNMAIKRKFSLESENSHNIKTEIKQRVNKLKSKFIDYYGDYQVRKSQDEKPEIMIYATKDNINQLVYAESIYHKLYLDKMKDFLKQYDKNNSIQMINEI